MRAAIGGAAIDVVAQPAAGRRKRLLVADLELTIIENEMLEEIAEFLGLRETVAAITRRAMNGEIDFASAVRERVAVLKGLPARVLDEAGAAHPHHARRARTRCDDARERRDLRPRHRRISAFIRAASAPSSASISMSRTSSKWSDGRLAGTVREPILGRAAKLETLRRLADERAMPLAATLAVGDGANDVAMIEAAGLGIAFHAKPAVAAQARHRIDHADLTALLYAQGYRRGEIVGGE